jgi:hypothetical protein
MPSVPSVKEWTNNVQLVLGTLGKEYGMFEFSSDHDLGSGATVELGNGLRIRPDVLWKDQDDKIKVIFEIDTCPSTSYPKTIYGSMLGGILLAKENNAEFVEVLRGGKNISKKAEIIAELFKKHFNEKMNVIEAPDTTDLDKMIELLIALELHKLKIIQVPTKP